jgi:hypothetical protein
MADILGMMDYIGQKSEEGRQRGQQSRLAGLVQQSMQAPRDQRQGLIAQMAGVSPAAAYDAESHFKGMDDNARARLGEYATAFDALPDEQKAQAYPQLAQQAQALGIPAPGQWDPSFAPNIQKLAQALGGNSGGGNVQSTQILANGNIGIVTRGGQVIDTGKAASPSTQLINEPGQLPYLVTTGRGQIGQTTGIGPSAGAASPPPRMDDQQIAEFANQMTKAGVPQDQVESWMRTQQGAPMMVGGQAPPAAPVPQRNPSAAETAAAEAAAKQAVELRNLPQRGDIEAENAAKKAAAEAAAKARSERDSAVATKAVDANRALTLLDEAERLLPLSTGSSVGNLVDAGAAVFGQSTTGAKAIAALQTIAGQLTSSMPRMQGPQSDKDVQLYKQMAGDLANPTLPVETRMTALQQIKRLNKKYAESQDRPNTSITQGGGGGTVWTRDANGKLVRSSN